MNYCPQCRSPLETGARFCQNCGHTLPGQAPPAAPGGPRPFAGQPGYAPPAQPGYGPPPAQPGYGPPPAQPGYAPPQPGYAPPAQPPGYGAPAPGPVPVAPPPSDEGGGMKVLGGCGLAGCLGVGFAALMGIGLILVLVMLGGSSGGGGSSSGPSSGVPNSGSLRSIVRPQVGAYRLVGTAPLEKVPADVVDSLGALYSGPGGVLVKQYLFVYPSEPMAAERIRNVFASSISDLKPGQKVSRGDLKNNDGSIIGTVVGLTGVDPESYYWNNRKLVVIVIAPAPHAKAFTTVSPY